MCTVTGRVTANNPIEMSWRSREPTRWRRSKISKTCLKRPFSKRPNMVFKTNFRLMLVKSVAECSKGEHSAILSTFIKLPFVIKIFVLYILSGRLRQVLLYIDSFIKLSFVFLPSNLFLYIKSAFMSKEASTRARARSESLPCLCTICVQTVNALTRTHYAQPHLSLH